MNKHTNNIKQVSGLYDGKKFVAVSNTGNGEVSKHTLFDYHQSDNIVWAEYSGGDIQKRFLVGTVAIDNSLEFTYGHVNAGGELRSGRCKSVPGFLPDGRIRLYETWQWLTGDRSAGTSVVEEVQYDSNITSQTVRKCY